MGLLRRIFLPTAMLMALFAAVLAGFALTANAQTGVSEASRLDTMQVIDGEVLDSIVVGNRIIVVGDFAQVRNPGGNTINQPYIAAYSADTGQFDGSFRPVVDNSVNAIERDGNAVFIVASSAADAGDGSAVAQRVVAADLVRKEPRPSNHRERSRLRDLASSV